MDEVTLWQLFTFFKLFSNFPIKFEAITPSASPSLHVLKVFLFL